MKRGGKSKERNFQIKSDTQQQQQVNIKTKNLQDGGDARTRLLGRLKADRRMT